MCFSQISSKSLYSCLKAPTHNVLPVQRLLARHNIGQLQEPPYPLEKGPLDFFYVLNQKLNAREIVP